MKKMLLGMVVLAVGVIPAEEVVVMDFKPALAALPAICKSEDAVKKTPSMLLGTSTIPKGKTITSKTFYCMNPDLAGKKIFFRCKLKKVEGELPLYLSHRLNDENNKLVKSSNLKLPAGPQGEWIEYIAPVFVIPADWKPGRRGNFNIMFHFRQQGESKSTFLIDEPVLIELIPAKKVETASTPSERAK